MLKLLALAILMAASPGAYAASYDFSGNLAEHFDQIQNSPFPSSSFQQDGKLAFHTNGVTMASASEIYVYRNLLPTYQQSWLAQVDVQVPASLYMQVPASNDAWASAMLIAFIRDGQGTLTHGISIDLEPDHPMGNQYWAGVWGDEETTWDVATSDIAGTIWLSFDAGTKVLSAYSAHGTLLTVDIDDPTTSWGMGAEDRFHIAIGFDAENMYVGSNEALTIDNFSVQAVPEPETYALMIAGLGLVGLAVQRRKPQ
ncbi:MAG TPA: PEP-CTERM sorting domain-containing protein [Thiobacillaceae bacterium]|nr:PEP-CTERM sorting domain-containing protein [Thiobacillaceae bacterium]